jgi:hypothetical protein
MASQDPPPTRPRSPSEILAQEGRCATLEEVVAYGRVFSDELAARRELESDEERERQDRYEERAWREAPAVAAHAHELAVLATDPSVSLEEFVAKRQVIISTPHGARIRAPRRIGARRRGARRPRACSRSFSRSGDSGDDEDPDEIELNAVDRLPVLWRARAFRCRYREWREGIAA